MEVQSAIAESVVAPDNDSNLSFITNVSDSTASIFKSAVLGDAGTDVTGTDDEQTSSQKSTRRRWENEGESISHFPFIIAPFPAENLFEYQWPSNKTGEYYMLQEQISEFLGIKSFKRKYPDLHRRAVEMEEKKYLKERGVVTETQCDLGLTALRTDEVMDLMIRDYPSKYQEYERVLNEKERQTISDKHKEYEVPSIERSKMVQYIKKAIKSAAEFNMNLNRERLEERRAYFDLQTETIQYPVSKMIKLDKEATKVSKYPVALIPGQFQEYYKKYSTTELKYLPINTALYGPPVQQKTLYAQPGTGETESDSDSESTGGSSDSNNDSGSGSSSSSSSSSDANDKTSTKVVVSASKSKAKTAECSICHKPGEVSNPNSADSLINCSDCENSGHPTCLDLTSEMVTVIKSYNWQCMECKTCIHCMDPYDEDKMMFCDMCDRGYHTFCVGVKSIPTGRWVCESCGVCAVCGICRPGTQGSKVQWHHEYSKGQERRLQRLLCQACHSKQIKRKSIGQNSPREKKITPKV